MGVEVVDYSPENTGAFKSQALEAPVKFIQFKPLLWKKTGPHLSMYIQKRSKDSGIIYYDTIVAEDPASQDVPHKAFGRRIAGEISRTPNSTAPVNILPESFTETAKIPFQEANFNDGYLSFNYKPKGLNKTFTVKIENQYLRAEFNAIEAYFPKALGGKKQFSVVITIPFNVLDITEIMASSAEIEQVNEDIIDSIKRQRVSKLTSTPLRSLPDKLIFTADDIFDSFDDNNKTGNIFGQSEGNILNAIIEVKDIRNKWQLWFLSGEKHSSSRKPRFTLKPLFGFLFFIEGNTQNHF